MIHLDGERYERDGFLIIRGIFAGERLARLRASADGFVAAAWAHPDLAGKRRLDLTEPRVNEPPLPLLDAIADPWILSASEVLARSRLTANLYQISVDSVDMHWHRDLVFLPRDLPWDVVAYQAETPFSQIQWNVPLVDDDFLHVVPGSHRRVDAAQEEILAASQREQRFIPEMPGALRVSLRAGDGVVYNNNLIHGVRRPPGDVVRRTVHWYWVRDGHADPYAWPQPPLGAWAERLHQRIRETWSRTPPSVRTSPHWRGPCDV